MERRGALINIKIKQKKNINFRDDKTHQFDEQIRWRRKFCFDTTIMIGLLCVYITHINKQSWRWGIVLITNRKSNRIIVETQRKEKVSGPDLYGYILEKKKNKKINTFSIIYTRRAKPWAAWERIVCIILFVFILATTTLTIRTNGNHPPYTHTHITYYTIYTHSAIVYNIHRGNTIRRRTTNIYQPKCKYLHLMDFFPSFLESLNSERKAFEIERKKRKTNVKCEIGK